MEKTKVLIVDDHVLIRKGIRLLLEEFSDIEVVGEANEGAEAITKANKYQPDVVFLDLSMPNGLDGFTASKAILAEIEDIKIILLTMHDGEIYIRQAVQSNIHGYLLKQVNPMNYMRQSKRFYKVGDTIKLAFLMSSLKSFFWKKISQNPFYLLENRELSN